MYQALGDYKDTDRWSSLTFDCKTCIYVHPPLTMMARHTANTRECRHGEHQHWILAYAVSGRVNIVSGLRKITELPEAEEGGVADVKITNTCLEPLRTAALWSGWRRAPAQRVIP